MKVIDIQDQPRLGVLMTFGMTLNGIRHRLARSLVTLAVIGVAIAFLMNTVSEGLIKRSMATQTTAALAQHRVAVAWVARLSRVAPIEQVLRQLAAAPLDGPAYEEARAMGGLDQAAMQTFRDDAILAAQYLGWIEALDYGKRRQLVHGALGAEAFDRLQDQTELERFESVLRTMLSVRFPMTTDAFAGLIQRWPQVKQQSMAVRDGWARAIAKVEVQLQGRALLAALEDIEGDFGHRLLATGFRPDRGDPALVALEAARMRTSEQVEQTLASLPLRQAVAAYLDLLPGQINTRIVWQFLRQRGRAAWYLRQLDEHSLAIPGLDVDALLELAHAKAEVNALVRASRLSGSSGQGVLSERMAWLAAVSMVVCIVGIANAMLMSVTQRFHEIATLKCLGALDEFIAMTFIMEACVLGVVGGLAGALIGLALGLSRMLVMFGGVLVPAIPYADLAVAVAVAVGAGIVLAAFATLVPALKAARLAPMEAMRVE
jgi:hypothetical protein